MFKSIPNKDEIIFISEYLEIPLVLILDFINFFLSLKFISIELFCISKFKSSPLLIIKLIFLSLSDLKTYFISVDKLLIFKSLFILISAFKTFALIS